jgi:hypothetical protein
MTLADMLEPSWWNMDRMITGALAVIIFVQLVRR